MSAFLMFFGLRPRDTGEEPTDALLFGVNNAVLLSVGVYLRVV
jgi:hypothetical protein